MNFAVIVFPGSSGDIDCYDVVENVLKMKVDYIWHKEEKFQKNYDCVILPGGFSYGDYLRPGALASLSPIVAEVINYAKEGGLVLGIGNGFQILTEAGLLPGALIKNENLKFICKDVSLKVINNNTLFTNNYETEQVIKMPVAHENGCYVCSEKILQELKDNKQIVFQYSSSFNGSMENIAGIINKEGNVLGMMPHPERCAEGILGNEDGKKLFTSIINALKGGTFRGK